MTSLEKRPHCLGKLCNDEIRWYWCTVTPTLSLRPSQVHTFYEAVGLMISSQTEPEAQEQLIDKFMALPNQVWDQVISQASASVDTLKDPEVIKQLGNILKTNVRGCKSLGHPYVKQVGYKTTRLEIRSTILFSLENAIER